MFELPLKLDFCNPSKMHIHGVLSHRVCVFRGDSGSGKSYLFKILYSYWLSQGVPCSCINLAGVLGSRVKLSNLFNVEPGTILLVDNGDLVPSKILLDALMTCPAGLVLVTNRGAIPRKFEGIVGRYSVQYDDKSFDIILQD